METIVLLLGGNLGDKETNIAAARKLIEKEIGTIVTCSAVKESKAWGFDAPDFMNQVVVCHSALSAEEVLFAIWEIEKTFGRERGTKEHEIEKLNNRKAGKIPFQSRQMDIDILYYGNQVIHTNLLEIPHPAIPERAFVQVLLNELNIKNLL